MSITTVEIARNGFASLRKRDPKLYKQVRNHIKACFDDTDWGYLHRNGTSKPRANKKQNLNDWAEGHGVLRPRKLSLKRLEQHCDGWGTIYTTSSPVSSYAVLLLDVDDKNGTAGDAQQVLSLVSSFFTAPDGGTIYGQPSTFGRGRHGYVFVDYSGMDRRQFRVVCRLLQMVLRRVLLDRGMKSTIEVKGVPGLRGSNGGYQKMGLLAKFPRLPSDDDWRDYLSRPTFKVSLIVDLLRRFGSKPHSDSTNDVSLTIYGRREAKDGCLSAVVEERPSDWLPPEERMGKVGRDLSRHLGRPASAAEVLSRYEALHCHTGEDDDGNRLELAQKTAAWIAQTWDWSKAGGERYEANMDRINDLLKKYVTAETKKAARKVCRYAYTFQQLSVVLYLIERGALRKHPDRNLQFTASNPSFTALMSDLDIQFDSDDDMMKKKLRSMKTVLLTAGLIEELNGGHWDYRKGKAFGLGVNHPDRDRYLKLHTEVTTMT